MFIFPLLRSIIQSSQWVATSWTLYFVAAPTTLPTPNSSPLLAFNILSPSFARSHIRGTNTPPFSWRFPKLCTMIITSNDCWWVGRLQRKNYTLHSFTTRLVPIARVHRGETCLGVIGAAQRLMKNLRSWDKIWSLSVCGEICKQALYSQDHCFSLYDVVWRSDLTSNDSNTSKLWRD
jgi:hypothetical protein